MLDMTIEEANRIIKEERLRDEVNTLKLINYQLTELTKRKAELEVKLAEDFGHGEDGAKTYKVGNNKVTVTSGWIYTLDKEKYNDYGVELPAQWNPVREVVKYELDKKTIREAEKYAGVNDLKLLASVITKKPSKIHVKVVEVSL